jgi:cytoplasmic iron level regulating protein YaaA (DUF328/UPF0246 family)
VLLILPPSETKRPPADAGAPVALEALSFPALSATRRAVLAALMATSAGPDAFRRLGVGHRMAEEVVRNTWLPEVPAAPVLHVYAGPLHQGLDAASLSPAAARRADREVVVVSALWGAVRPADRIPPYRLHPCARLVGVDRLEPAWRAVLPAALAEAAGPRGVVIDLRSPAVQALGLPNLPGRTLTLRVAQGASGRRLGDVVAKRIRGEAARLLLEADGTPEDPDAVASLLGARWPVALRRSPRAGVGWTLTLLAAD